MRISVHSLGAAVLCAAMLVVTPASAQSTAEPSEGARSHAAQGQGGGSGGAHRGYHDAFGASWYGTLSDNQKGDIRLSYLRMRQKQTLLRARVALQEAEIAGLIAGDETEEGNLEGLIDALGELRKEQAMNRYRHLVEVRQLLTPAQRVPFDLWMISGRGTEAYR